MLGRTALQENMSSGTSVPVGFDNGDGTGIPGCRMFQSDLVTKPATIAATLVEPESEPDAGDGHSEAVTVTYPSGEPLHLTIAVAPTYNYTVAAGAYITPQSLPTVISDLKIVKQDLALPPGPTGAGAEKLPALLVRLTQVAQDHAGSNQWRYEYLWDCSFWRRRVESEDPDAFYEDFEAILNQAEDDVRLGGTVEECHWRNARRIPDVAGQPVDEGQFTVWARVDHTNNKFPG